MTEHHAEAPKVCPDCGEPSKWGGRCGACIIADFDEPDDDFDPEGPAFECAGYNDGSGFYCPLWGTEECDWECPR